MGMGVLYVVATPIGNLEDMSARAAKILREVDWIACEDTRHTRKLLRHYGIKTKTVSYHEHIERARSEKIVEQLNQGKNVALVSDAGMPGVSDPGEILVRAAIAAGGRVVPIPGPSALITALAASGLPTERFAFEGFLPPKSGARRFRLQELKSENRTLLFYEAPHRLLETLLEMEEILGSRRGVVVRELTKIHEEFVRAPLHDLRAIFAARPSIKGEIVLIVEGATGPAAVVSNLAPEEEARKVMADEGLSLKEAAKQVARRRGLQSRALYQRLIGRPGRRID